MRGDETAAWPRLLLGLVLSAALLLVIGAEAPDVASAGSYVTYVCHDDAGGAMPADLVVQRNKAAFPDQYFQMTNTCAGGGQGAVELTLAGCSSCYFDSVGIAGVLAAPAGETISAYNASFTSGAVGCHVIDNSCRSGHGETTATDSAHASPPYLFHAVGPAVGGPYAIGATGLSAGFVSFYAGCVAQPSSCNTGDVIAGLHVSQVRAVFNDSTTPQVLGVGGALVSGQPVSGTQAVNFSAQDAGGGIYAEHAYVDGNLVLSSPVDLNGGRCVDHGGTPAVHSFGYVQPCKANVAGSLTLDSTQWADGVHRLRIDVEDAAGDRASVYDGQLTIANRGAGAASALSLALGVAPAAGASAGPPAGAPGPAGCAPAASSTLAPGPGDAAELTVHLSCGGRAMSAVAATVTDAMGFRRQLTTDAGGTLRVAVPHRRSRLSLSIAGATLDLSMHLRSITFSISPHVTSNRHAMRWRGVVTDGRPGMKLLLEVRRGRSWTIFDQTSVDRSGRFSYRYTFHATRGTVRYSFRVVARDGSVASTPRSILVRG